MRSAVRAGEQPLPDDELELGRDLSLVTPAFERAPEQFFVGEGAVDLRSIEEGAP